MIFYCEQLIVFESKCDPNVAYFFKQILIWVEPIFCQRIQACDIDQGPTSLHLFTY